MFFLIFPTNLFSNPQKITTFFGETKIENSVAIEVLKTSSFQKLGKAHMQGAPHYFGFVPSYTYYEHALGVYALLKKFNFPLKQQVAGLLHPLFHSSFFNLTEYMSIGISNKKIYQSLFKEESIKKIIKSLDLVEKDLRSYNDPHEALKEKKYSMSADWIEYVIHTGFLYEKITKEEVFELLQDLRFRNGKWFFINSHSAQKLGELSLYLTEHICGSTWYGVINHWTNQALKRAIYLGIIDIKYLYEATDEKVFKVIKSSKDSLIKNYIYRCENIHTFYEVSDSENFDVHIKPSFKGIDPLVLVNEEIFPLSVIKKDFKKEFDRVKEKMRKGFKIKFIP